MKTLTEFAAITLKNAASARSDLVAQGKTPEELLPALGEALKLEAEKLTLLLTALDVIGTKTDDLKRAVVYTLAEGETPPKNVHQNGEHYFLIEYYPPLVKKREKNFKERGKGKGPRGRKKGRGKRPNRSDRPDRNDQTARPQDSDGKTYHFKPRKKPNPAQKPKTETNSELAAIRAKAQEAMSGLLKSSKES